MSYRKIDPRMWDDERFVAPWSRTRGTQHTARLAREHGITVEVLVCPAEHGPGGVR